MPTVSDATAAIRIRRGMPTRTPLQQAALRLLFVVAVPYAVVALGAWLGQRWLLYPRGAAEPPIDRGEYERVPFDADGAHGEVPLWIVTNPIAPTAPLVVWFHGNAEQLADEGWPQQSLVVRGVSFAGAEFPGYGDATGAGPTEATLFAAARASLTALQARPGAAGVPVVCVGMSLGSGVAAAMAAEGRCARLVLLSAYTSLPQAAQAVHFWLPGRWLVEDQLDTAGRAASITVPTLLIHGRDDATCPLWMGRQLAATIPNATLVERDGGHGVLDGDVYDRVAAFAKGP